MTLRPYHIAETYDPMSVRRIPYSEVARFLAAKLRSFSPEVHTVLEIACGTANLTIPLAREGFRMFGLDFSPEMLELARRKTAESQLDIDYLCQDMTLPYPLASLDAVVCFYGGLNFLNTPQLLSQALAAVGKALKPGGLFLFEQYGPALMRSSFAGMKAADFDNFYVVLKSKTDEAGQIEHNVTFFLCQPDGSYRREDEQHNLRIHPFEEIEQSLGQAGFRLLECNEIYPTQLNIAGFADNYLFVAQKI
jgi:SAM-dependent methyltransferase